MSNNIGSDIPTDAKQTEESMILQSLRVKAAKRRIEKKHFRMQNEKKIIRHLRLEHHNRVKEIPFDCVVCGFESDTLSKFFRHIKNDHYRQIKSPRKEFAAILSQECHLNNADSSYQVDTDMNENSDTSMKEVVLFTNETRSLENVEDNSLDNCTTKICLNSGVNLNQHEISSMVDQENLVSSSESDNHLIPSQPLTFEESNSSNHDHDIKTTKSTTSSLIIVPDCVESVLQKSDQSEKAETDCAASDTNQNPVENHTTSKEENVSPCNNLGLQILSTVSLSTCETIQDWDSTISCNKSEIIPVHHTPPGNSIRPCLTSILSPDKGSLMKSSGKKRKHSTTSRLESIVQSLKTEHGQNHDTSNWNFNMKILDGKTKSVEEKSNVSTHLPTTSIENVPAITTSSSSPSSSIPKWKRCSSPTFSVPYSNLSTEGIVTMHNSVVYTKSCHPVHIFMLLGSYFQFPYPQPEEVLYLSQRTRLNLLFVKTWFVKKRLKHGISWSPDEVLNAWAFITERHKPTVDGSNTFYTDRLNHCQSLNQCDLKMTSSVVLKENDVSSEGNIASTNGYMTVSCTCSNVHLIGAVQHEVLISVRHTITLDDLKPGGFKLDFIANMTCLKDCAVITFYKDIML